MKNGKRSVMIRIYMIIMYSLLVGSVSVMKGSNSPSNSNPTTTPATTSPTYNELPDWLNNTKTEDDILTALNTKLPNSSNERKKLVNMYDPYGYTALMLMASKGYLEAVRVLLEEGADPKQLSNNDARLTALHSAVNAIDLTNNGVEIIRVLLKYGADPATPNQLGNNAIHELRNVKDLQKRFAALQIMLDMPTANINAQNKSGDTLLHLAVLDGQKDFIYQLMNNPTLWSSIDLSIRNKRGQTAEELAKDFKKGLDDGINTLLANKTKVIGQGGRVTEVDDKGRTGLMLAMGRDDLKFAKEQITGGADINAKSANGSTPIHYAVRAQKNTLQYVKMILDTKKADLNAINSYGETPLLQLYNNVSLTTADRVQIAKLLIENGANALLKDKDGNILLHIAALVGDVAMINFLKSPSGVVVKNSKGETPTDMAQKSKVSPQATAILQAEAIKAN